MKIAIPIFGNRVSPRFDFSREMLIITVERGKTANSEKLSMVNYDISGHLDRLVSLGVDKVICGGIDFFSLSELGRKGIEVIYDIMGEAEVAFDLFLKGALRTGWCCEERRKSCSPGKDRGFLKRGE